MELTLCIVASCKNNERHKFQTLVGIWRFQYSLDWENNKCIIENMLLVPIMSQVMEVKSSFDDLSFTHIYREFNTKSNTLSK
jgi:hypothetical protein